VGGSPLVDLKLFKNRTFVAGLAMAFLFQVLGMLLATKMNHRRRAQAEGARPHRSSRVLSEHFQIRLFDHNLFVLLSMICYATFDDCF
jgi:hypothetical protein